MRRFLFGVVIASVTAAMPGWAFGGDREIAEGIMSQLQQAKSQGQLKGFDLDLKVESGVVYLSGSVRSNTQHGLIVDAVEHTQGVSKMVDNLRVVGDKPAKPASTVVPASADEEVGMSATDVSITDTIISKLQQQKQAGALKGFDLDVTTTGGDVSLRGRVNSQEQKAMVLDIARRVRGVRRVIDDVSVSSAVRQASTSVPSPSDLQPVPQSSMPVVGGGTPRPFAPAHMANMQNGNCYTSDMGAPTGMPMPMQGAGASYGQGAPRYDQANMPSYAWPSYAAYPNYAAVTYPKQYSPSAWPYIGPFYPYPQVPLRWRKVALEWDDGLWYLDFTSK